MHIYLKLFSFVFILSQVSGCLPSAKLPKRKSDETVLSPAHFDEVKQGCFDQAGFSQFNEGQLTECGRISGANLSGEDLRGMNLRGMQFISCNLSGANISDADLFGASFTDTDLSGANLTGAIAVSTFTRVVLDSSVLHGTRFISWGADSDGVLAIFNESSAQGAEIDSRTLLIGSLDDAINKFGMRYRNADVTSLKIKLDQLRDVGFEVQINRVGDTAVSGSEYARLKDDLTAISALSLSDDDDGWFQKIFGGTKGSNLLEYVSERIRFFISKSKVQEDNENINVLASNYGSSFWGALYGERGLGRIQTFATFVNSINVVIDTPRAGLVSIGPQYSNLSTTSLRRMSTIIHEARHSDCAFENLPSNTDLITYIRDEKAPDKMPCNFGHAKCPLGHPLSGLAACDNVAWGSYGVALVFSEKIVQGCNNCDEEMQQLALIASKDMRTRVLVLEDMLSGKLGNPNMDSIP